MTELQRYWEYIQRQIMPEGWESRFDEKKTAHLLRESKRWKEDPAYQGTSFAKQLSSRLLDSHEPQTQFDSAIPHAIFQPVLDQLLEESNSGPWPNLRPVRLLASTDPAPTPLARPSASEHLLLIGQGTASFCNYWAKVFAPIVVRLFVQEQSYRVRSDAEIEAASNGVPQCINLASILGLNFALLRTTLLVGRIITQPEHLKYRTELLTAMECFIVAHELSHFIAYEQIPGADGMMSSEEQRTIELFCDDVGLALSRAVAAKQECFLGRSGVAAILFFRTIAWGEELRKAMGIETTKSGSHPSCQERIQLIRARVEEFDDDKVGLLAMLAFYDAMCESVIRLATRRLNNVFKEIQSGLGPIAGG